MDAWMSFQKSWMDMMSKGMPTGGGKTDTPVDPFQMWRGLWEQPGAGKWQDLTGMQHVLSSFGAYARLFDAWNRTGSSAGRGDSADVAATLFDAWREIAEDLGKRWAAAFSPAFGAAAGGGQDPMAAVEGLFGSFEPLKDFYVQIFTPWRETVEKLWRRFADLAGRQPSAETVEGFHSAWMEAYEETLGRVVRIPSVGPAREKHDLVLRCLDAAARWQGASLEFALEMQIPAREAFEKVASKAASLVGPEAGAEDFQRFYEELSREMEGRIFELFKTERFAAAMKTTLSTSLDFFKLQQDLVEQSLKGTPIVTRTEMDEVEQELVAVRRKVERQEAEIAALRDALSGKGAK
jgi:hypothetical protein